ncbi:HYR domain-containing protein [Corallococcus macrosporus]|uniref:HYR domain-containing protein n=1 Tax=Corallococcus macrosporus TaxID=35 RepID=A0ABS3D2X3_9BACT|nr:ELWxxDGT repeat protein [Corallococcus macrosporus]MBN8225982.1 HYR domain-containing protein [Corallococcus macrosporus]
MGKVSGRAWLSALSLVVGATPAFAQGEPVAADPMSVRRVADLTSAPRLEPEMNRPDTQATARLNGRLYFLAIPRDATGPYVQDLWVTDGTFAGTRSVQGELLPPNTSIDPGSLRATPQRLFFTATSPGVGRELWTSDGTREGTHVTRELNPGALDGVAFQAPVFVAGDSVLFASGGMGETEFDLWKSDGTEAGTVPVKDILPGTYSSRPGGFVRAGNTVFFVAEGAEGRELWRTDGTEAGTRLVRDIRPGTGHSLPLQLTAVGSTLYFTAEDGQHGRALWKSDGTEAGTVMVAEFAPTGTGPSLHHFTALGDTLLFLVTGTPEGIELWRTDGTEAGTLPVKTLPRSMLEGPPGLTLVPVDNRVFILGRGGASGDSLWVTDGTSAGTVRIPRPTESGLEAVRGFTPFEGGLAFIVTTAPGASELWHTDGTLTSTSRLTRLPSGNTSALPTGLVSHQGALLTTAGDAWTPRALWRMERDAAPPTFVCPVAREVASDHAEGTWVKDLTPAMVSSPTQVTIRTTHPSYSLLPLHRPTLVTWQASDATGRLAYCATSVTSRDLTGPAINGCPTELTVGTRSPQGLTFYYPTPNIQDETSRDVLVTYSPLNGSVLPMGTTQVTMTAKDTSGNVTTCSFPVTIRDGQPPTGACKVSEVRVEAEGPQGAHAYWPDSTPTDTISSQVSVRSSHASGDLFPLGLTRVEVVSTDEAGNSTTCEIQVRVRDSRPPLLSCPVDQTLTSAVMSGTRAEYPLATAEDAVSATEISYSPVVGTPLAPGLHSVQVTAIDAAGNASLCNFHLTVQYDPTSDMRQGMGCSVGSGPSSALGWVALLALAWTVSRRVKDGRPRG